MHMLAIASAAAAVALGGVGAPHPADRPHIGHCHASVVKPQISHKGSAPERPGANDRSVRSGVDLHCK